MERNYDVIISEMLIQIDKHSEELAAIRSEQSVLNQTMLKSLDNQFILNQGILKSLDEQSVINARTLSQFDELSTNLDKLSTRLDDQNNVNNHLLTQIVHSASILDRIIKKNDLKV